MAKTDFKPGTMIYPLPAVMVSVGDETEKNILTVAWTGTICSDPAMCYISVRKSRHSYAIIERTKEFVINLTTRRLARATDWCGVRSGKDCDKFEKMHLTAGPASKVKAPIIEESPVSIECQVVNKIELGTHDMFIANVVNVRVDSELIDENGKFDLKKADLLAYSHGEYFSLGKVLGTFGWSVRKKKSPSKKKDSRR